jgi:hypothetical protein
MSDDVELVEELRKLLGAAVAVFDYAHKHCELPEDILIKWNAAEKRARALLPPLSKDAS